MAVIKTGRNDNKPIPNKLGAPSLSPNYHHFRPQVRNEFISHETISFALRQFAVLILTDHLSMVGKQLL